MVDDRTQRPFGSNEPARGAPKAGGSSGSDPLAELARLIGQNDPFGEFGRDGARRASAPPPHEPPQAWTDVPQPAAEPAPPVAHQSTQDFFGAQPSPSVLPPNFGRQAFGSTAPNDDMYHVEGSAPAYAAAPVPGYENDPYQTGHPQLGPEQDDFYEDEPPSRRRMGILVIAGVFALAVVGTAGAFGYRAIFGSSSSSVPPPVIKAETAPSKIVPAASKDPQSNKQITDRINDKGMGERLVSREEQPVAIMPQADPAPPSSMPPATGSGVVGGAEPKKVRTIAIRPDQGTSDVAPQGASASAAPPPSSAQPAPVRVIPTSKPATSAQPQRAASNPPPADDPEPAPRAAAPPRQAAAPANAPLSLNPNAAPARASAPAPVARTAAVAPSQSAPAAGGGGYLVQVSSQRSEAEAQSAFTSLQGKFPGQLGGKQAVIRKVELGEKGTYYRAMVPAGDSAEANQMCSGIKAAGGSCLVQKN